jgi:Protein of unknown function (DUF4238)
MISGTRYERFSGEQTPQCVALDRKELQESQMTSRRSHHVSQCYLKGFVANRDDPKLYVVDLKECKNFTTNPINVAVERDFHRIDVDGHEPDAIENAFSDFETSPRQ